MSVIVPVFNSARTIVQTLRSVVDQTYDDWELIVGDDGSSDGSADLARAVSPRIAVVTAAINQGPAAARNLAIAHASGELLAFLDADDLWLPQYLESQVRTFDFEQQRRGDVGVVACDAHLEDAAGRRIEGTYRDRVPFPEQVTIETLLEGNPIFVSALTPSQIVRDVGGFDPRTFGSEDHDLWLKIVEQGFTVVDNPAALVVYRLLGSSVSSHRAGMARTQQTTCRLALERGLLSPRQRRLARRQLRLQMAVEAVEDFLTDDKSRRSLRSVGRLTSALVAFAVFAVNHPHRWPHWFGAAVRGRAAWRTPVR